MNDKSQFALLTERRFLPLFLTQFLGAANDNIFKFAFTVLATYNAADWGGMDPKSAGAVIGGLFILPFVLFSATAGQLADKYDKAALIRLVKNLEIAIMLVIAAGFVLKIVSLLFVGVFLMGLHSTLFGPVKYAYLPQHLNDSELIGGNGMVEMGTFVAILLGTILGGVLIGIPGTGPDWVAAVSLLLAVAGRIVAGYVPSSPAPDPGLSINWNPVTETLANLGHARSNRAVYLSLLGISWMWFFGAIFLTTFSGFAKETLGGDQNVVTLLLAVFSLGIGVGSLLCERFSGHKVEIGLVPFGSIGMTIFAVDLWLTSGSMLPSAASPAALVSLGAFLADHTHWRIMADLFLLAMFAGFYSVPLYALIQSRCEPSHRARIIAANNILNALFMVAASLMTAVLLHAGLSLPQLYLVVGLLNAVVAIYIYTLVPEFLMRFLIWMLVHSVYRLEKKGLEHIPEQGPALLVCNHVSYVDALIIAAACRRPIRFVMDHHIYRIPILNFIFRTGRAIPIASFKDDPVVLERAYDEIAKALEAGDLVCIFPEGKITNSGQMNPFKPGVQRIIQRTPVPVVPLALCGLWNSLFSRKPGGLFKTPGVLFSRIGLVAAQAVPPADVTPEQLQQVVFEMRGERL